MFETEAVPAAVSVHLLPEEPRDAVATERGRADAAEAKVAEYENAIAWNTSCTSCARLLDSCIAETGRRVHAEDALAAERERADAATAGLGKVAGAASEERKLAEAADAKVLGARAVLGNFLGRHGESEMPGDKVALDLAGSLWKILGGDGLPGA